MEIFKHYSKGTVIIDSEGNYTGYYPDRNEKLLNVHQETVIKAMKEI